MDTEYLVENEIESVSENDLLSSSLLALSTNDFYGFCLNSFDRVIDGIPAYYGYYGVITDTEGYLYYGSESSVNGLNISFGADCKEVHLYDDDGFKIEITSFPSASFVVGSSDVVYTNLISGFPSLGDNELSLSGIAALFLVSSALIIVFNRSRR